MCGIVGEFFLQAPGASDEGRILAMQQSIRHRGPDDDGIFLTPRCGMGFRRLSIIDIEGGHQPMCNEDGSVWVSFNGEIYNFQELRASLRESGHIFRSNSDTEVIVHLYEKFGLDFCRYLRGMFGIAVYDSNKQQLILARDRFGIKPVYYWRDAKKIVYGSEIKALLSHPDVPAEPNEEGIFQFLALRHTLQPDTMFSGIQKLPSASILVANSSGTEIRSYWRMPDSGTDQGDFESASRNYESALTESIQNHLLADVPLGLYLSGGLDSSVLAALVQKQSSTPAICFTASFEGVSDESSYAREVASHIGADHHVIPIQPPSPEILKEIVWHLDEPIGDLACLPTFLLSREAAKEVKVVLTGEGSDETNAGYSAYLRYFLFSENPAAMKAAQLLWPILARLPKQSEKFSLYRRLWNQPDELGRFLESTGVDRSELEIQLKALAPHLHHHLKGIFHRMQGPLDSCSFHSPLHRLLEFSRSNFMREDLLTKVDRMTMAHGLEARVPYLDHPTAEIASGFSSDKLLKGNQTKAVLRAIAEKHLPASITNRGQHGFLVPMEKWFDGDFSAYIADVLRSGKAKQRKIFSHEAVVQLLEDFQKTGKHSRMIWKLVLLELWHREYID